jgi:hypothetical protein
MISKNETPSSFLLADMGNTTQKIIACLADLAEMTKNSDNALISQLKDVMLGEIELALKPLKSQKKAPLDVVVTKLKESAY